MNRVDVLLAKSVDEQADIPSYAKLVPHLRAVERAGETIVDVSGELLCRQLDLPTEPWLRRLRASVKMACLLHDIGKANESFQKMVRHELPPTKQPARHELLAALLLTDPNCPLRLWTLSQLKNLVDDSDAESVLNCIIGAIAGHHLKLDVNWKKAALALDGGCGTELRMMLTHEDLVPLFRQILFNEEKCFSLIEGSPEFIGSRRLRFAQKSNRWKEALYQDLKWWRFAAATKALVAAADVVGSAMLPAKENIRRWVSTSLLNYVLPESLDQVVKERLRGKPPRTFQESVAESPNRVTLVEAGCGTGKTIAAYLWARHHAISKKLFFCYPTTGTATEGFLGYVHESDIEAELVHSRSMIDLESISRVSDEDEREDLLKVESLRMWGPQVIVCTADSVIALVRNNRRGLYNSPSILSGAFVFDELHAYSDRMLAGVLALIKALPGASFLLMTASLPPQRKRLLLDNIETIREIPSSAELERIKRYEFQMIESSDRAIQLACEALEFRQQKILWICNSVEQAQRLFEDLDNRTNGRARTYHSRFKYLDRVDRHRAIIKAFDSSQCGGIIAVTTQVAEMSLDLDADLLISEVAPIPALIQRLGRLNRRVTMEKPGVPRRACFYPPNKRSSPYEVNDLDRAIDWVKHLVEQQEPLSQQDLVDEFHRRDQQSGLMPDMHTNWLDSGWFAEPEPVREVGCSVSVILKEDERVCRQDRQEIIRRSIPMNYSKDMISWPVYKGVLIAPEDAIDYDPVRGARLHRSACRT